MKITLNYTSSNNRIQTMDIEVKDKDTFLSIKQKAKNLLNTHVPVNEINITYNGKKVSDGQKVSSVIKTTTKNKKPSLVITTTRPLNEYVPQAEVTPVQPTQSLNSLSGLLDTLADVLNASRTTRTPGPAILSGTQTERRPSPVARSQATENTNRRPSPVARSQAFDHDAFSSSLAALTENTNRRSSPVATSNDADTQALLFTEMNNDPELQEALLASMYEDNRQPNAATAPFSDILSEDEEDTEFALALAASMQNSTNNNEAVLDEDSEDEELARAIAASMEDQSSDSSDTDMEEALPAPVRVKPTAKKKVTFAPIERTVETKKVETKKEAPEEGHNSSLVKRSPKQPIEKIAPPAKKMKMTTPLFDTVIANNAAPIVAAASQKVLNLDLRMVNAVKEADAIQFAENLSLLQNTYHYQITICSTQNEMRVRRGVNGLIMSVQDMEEEQRLFLNNLAIKPDLTASSLENEMKANSETFTSENFTNQIQALVDAQTILTSTSKKTIKL